jgi:hypothetical protein
MSGEVIQFVPRPGARPPLPKPREGEVDLDSRRGMGVRRDPAVSHVGPDGEGPEAA